MCTKRALRYGSPLPPLYKYAIFYVCGFELLFNAVLMTVAQEFYSISSVVFPIAFSMFDDTVQRQTTDFQWRPVEHNQLLQYQTKLIALWAISTFCVIYAVFCVVPQFYTFEDAEEDSENTVCLKFPRIGWYMGIIYVILMVICGAVLFWCWLTCQADHDLFHSLFLQTLKEEKFVSELEKGLQCTSDDDKEVHRMSECDNRIDRGVLASNWLTPLLTVYVVGHAFVLLTYPILNKSFRSSPHQKQNEVKATLMES